MVIQDRMEVGPLLVDRAGPAPPPSLTRRKLAMRYRYLGDTGLAG